jgi:hypothetical protein
MKGKGTVWLMAVPETDDVCIVRDELNDNEVYLDATGAKKVDAEVKGRTVKRVRIPGKVVGQERGYTLVELPNGAKVHVKAVAAEAVA